MYSLLARNYLVNNVLAGRFTEDTYKALLKVGKTKEGVKAIAVNMMALSLEVEHDFELPEELAMAIIQDDDNQETHILND
jgi:hypothetical protein